MMEAPGLLSTTDVKGVHLPQQPSFAHQVCTLLWKDSLIEWRTRERLAPTMFFVLLILLVFNFAFELGGAAVTEIGPGVLWTAYIFASLFGLNQTFSIERENHCVDAVLLAVSPSSLYLSKVVGNFLFLMVVEIISLPFFALFFNLAVGRQLLFLVPVLVLGSAGLASVGTLCAAMSQHSRLRELMLPLLLLPVVVPVIISCVEATAATLEQTRLGPLPYLVDLWWSHLQILAVYSIVFTTLSTMLFEYVVREP